MKKMKKKVVLSLVGITMIVLMISPVFGCDCGCTCPEKGKITGGGQGEVAGADMVPAGSFGFNVMWYSRDPRPKGHLNYVDHTLGIDRHIQIYEMRYLEVWELNPGNKPWPRLRGVFGGYATVDGEEGYWVDVYIKDVKEPGNNDDGFQITVYRSSASNLRDEEIYYMHSFPILTGNIQIHKPPK